MGLFGDKCILRLHAAYPTAGNLQLQMENLSGKHPHLLPISCISLVESQFTVLDAYHPASLSKKLLEFILEPKAQVRGTTYVPGFVLELHEGSGRSLKNQFKPDYPPDVSQIGDHVLQLDIENIIADYVSAVYFSQNVVEQDSIRYLLCLAIEFYWQQLAGKCRATPFHDTAGRMRIAETVIAFTSSAYRRWEGPKFFAPGSAAFTEHVNALLAVKM